jgi:hypothetical protein
LPSYFLNIKYVLVQKSGDGENIFTLKIIAMLKGKILIGVLILSMIIFFVAACKKSSPFSPSITGIWTLANINGSYTNYYISANDTLYSYNTISYNSATKVLNQTSTGCYPYPSTGLYPYSWNSLYTMQLIMQGSGALTISETDSTAGRRPDTTSTTESWNYLIAGIDSLPVVSFDGITGTVFGEYLLQGGDLPTYYDMEVQKLSLDSLILNFNSKTMDNQYSPNTYPVTNSNWRFTFAR